LKTFLKIGLLLASSLCVTALACAANAANGAGTATVILQEPLSITETNGGMVFPTINPNGSGFLLYVHPQEYNHGAFTVTGGPNTTIQVIPPDSVTLTGPGGTMQVVQFTFDQLTVNGSSNTGVLSSSGALDFFVGAALEVPAYIAPGTYSGQYAITVQYQ
jgi:hypothetical protein